VSDVEASNGSGDSHPAEGAAHAKAENTWSTEHQMPARHKREQTLSFLANSAGPVDGNIVPELHHSGWFSEIGACHPDRAFK
jgi:hypothetical protein